MAKASTKNNGRKAVATKKTAVSKARRQQSLGENGVAINKQQRRKKKTELEELIGQGKQESQIEVESIMAIGVNPNKTNMRSLLRGKNIWNFDHIDRVVRQALDNNPGCDAFILFGQPEIMTDEDTMQLVSYPIVHLILVQQGYQPPPFLAISGVHGEETIVPMSELHLVWKKVKFSHSAQVFTLHCTKRFSSMDDRTLRRYEYGDLYIMRPSTDWIRKGDGRLDVQIAKFAYDTGKEVIDEEYIKGGSLKDFIEDFCKRHEIDLEQHGGPLKESITAGFQRARDELEQKIARFSNYEESVLDNIKVIKVYPDNDVLNGDGIKNPYLNKYYGKANEVV